MLFLEISGLSPAMGHVSQCWEQFLKSAMAESKSIYKLAMDMLKVLLTKLLSMKICRQYLS